MLDSKKLPQKTILDKIYKTFKEPQEITNRDNFDFHIQVNCPPGYKQSITAYAMPFDINSETLNEITQTWGDLKFYKFRRHEKCPLISNPSIYTG